MPRAAEIGELGREVRGVEGGARGRDEPRGGGRDDTAMVNVNTYSAIAGGANTNSISVEKPATYPPTGPKAR